jgi:N-acetylglutamate synthase-like GNAT family acetyltransferase
MAIRRELRLGDLGAILALHARLITREYGLDSTHEGYVGASLTEHAARGFPSRREGIWVVERDGEVAGSIGLTDDGDNVASLRWLVLDPSLRGRGLGRRLVSELISEAREKGFARVHLETFSELCAAAHLYRAHGFELTHAETGPRWGRDEITYEQYALGPLSPP